MTTWRPQHFQKDGKARDIEDALLSNAVATGKAIIAVNPSLPVIFSLRHLSHLSGVDYGYLRAIVSRTQRDSYRVFKIKKRQSKSSKKRFRMICVPAPALMQVQRWIAKNILEKGNPHFSSVAYAKGNTTMAAADLHCRCRWLIKLDVKNFFESISEISAYRVFCSFGYQPLVAVELARICTRMGSLTRSRKTKRWQVENSYTEGPIAYQAGWLGHLPQGAPTSPMLANLAMYNFDSRIAALTDDLGLVYTRYADDLAISTADSKFDRKKAGQVVGAVYSEMGRIGLSPNVTKTSIAPPSARKVVLGLLVDRKTPRLTREFKSNLRRHLYYLNREGIGPVGHADARGFNSVAGLRNHVQGLVSYARQVEIGYGQRCMEKFLSINWPI